MHPRRAFLTRFFLPLLFSAVLSVFRSPLGAESTGFSFVSGNAEASDDRIWTLLILPSESAADAPWLDALDRFGDLKLTVALSPKDWPRLAPVRERILQQRKTGRLEAALRLAGDPILPIIYDLESVRPFLRAETALPAARIGWMEDVTVPVARARAQYKGWFGDFPSGFVPGGGSLSLPVAEALRAQKFQWTVLGASEPEWPAGETLGFQGGMQDALRIFSEHPASRVIYAEAPPPANSPVPAVPAKQDPPLVRAVREMFHRIEEAHFQQQLPIVVYDQRRARFPLNEFLEECSRQMKELSGFKMILPQDTRDKNFFRLSDSLQIWPYSWSWVQGAGSPSGPGLTAWIGDREKNAAWELLSRTREDVERYKNSGSAELERLDRALEPLYLAESGEFFESFGTGATAPEQEKRFKSLLAGVYRNIRSSVPEALRVPLSELTSSVQTDTATAAQPGSSIKENTPLNLRIELKKQSAAWSQDDPDRPGPSLKRFSVQIASGASGEAALFSFTAPNAVPGTVLDLYIDINHRDGAGNMVLLPGRRAMVDSDEGWEYVLVCRAQSGRWDCQLFRGSASSLVYRAAVADKGGSFSVKIPKNLLGLDPLRWGYLVCIMDKDGGSIVDVLSPVADKPKALADLKEKPSAAPAEPGGLPEDPGIKVLLPMMRARPDSK